MVLLSRNPEPVAEQLAKQRVIGYTRNPQALVRDLKVGKSRFQTLVDLLRGKAGREWGQDEVVVPSQKRYVKYTQILLHRRIQRRHQQRSTRLRG